MKGFFDLKNRVVTIAPEGLLIPEFKALWDRDESDDKSAAMRELSYVYFMMDYKSPYRASLTPEQAAQVVAKDFMKDEGYSPDEFVQAAMTKYSILQRTPSMLLLDASLKTVYNLIDYLEKVDLQERDDKNKPIYKPNDVTTALGKIGTIVDSINKVRTNVEKEITQSASLRGQRKKGNREDPR